MNEPAQHFSSDKRDTSEITAQLIALYPDELGQVAEGCDNIMSSGIASIEPYYRYLRQTRGKMIRSIALFESARATGCISSWHITAACALELMHFASLVHDDIIDETPTRRGIPAVHIQYDTRTAVILGDLLLSKGLNLFASLGDASICDLVANTMEKIVEGELHQYSCVPFDFSLGVPVDRATYLSIIERKTASLFGTAMYLGAYLNNDNSASLWKTAGMALGMAFQIMDDVADTRKILQKETISNSDKRELLTLPVIIALESLRYPEKELAINHIEHATQKTLKQLYKMIQENGCMDRVQSCVQAYLTTASQTMNTELEEKSFFTLFSRLIAGELYL